MTSSNPMCCHSCNGSQEPFFNKAMFGLTRQGSHDCLRHVTVPPWSAQSLYLHPIEHIWDHLGRRAGHLTSLNELETRL
ncbi:uncharacterized protein TNCV_566941 [Trichonephila clavipes]|nr:uncharacterized protein TNCV_566941 [Trichonephila clavipes]